MIEINTIIVVVVANIELVIVLPFDVLVEDDAVGAEEETEEEAAITLLVGALEKLVLTIEEAPVDKAVFVTEAEELQTAF